MCLRAYARAGICARACLYSRVYDIRVCVAWVYIVCVKDNSIHSNIGQLKKANYRGTGYLLNSHSTELHIISSRIETCIIIIM